MRVLINSWWTTVEQNPETGKWDCLIPEESGWERDDLLLIELRGSKVRFVNLSEIRVHKSRFLREQCSLQRKLTDPCHPLRRVLIVERGNVGHLAWPKCDKPISRLEMTSKKNCYYVKIEEM